jgi:DNA-binding LacI/PurR family transcriptional regulator
MGCRGRIRRGSSARGAQGEMTGIRRLAQQLNVSIGTVSRALNGKPDVNEETRKRVLEAAAELGYGPTRPGGRCARGRPGWLAS